MGIIINSDRTYTYSELQQMLADARTDGYADGYSKYPIQHPCDQVTPYNNGHLAGYNEGYAKYPIDHPVVPPPPDVDRGSLEFFSLYPSITLQAIKRDGTQLGADIYLNDADGTNYRYFNHEYFISNDVTVIRVITDDVLKNMEIISYDLGSNAPKAVSDTHLTASPEHVSLGNTWDCNYYPDLKTQYVFSVIPETGTIEIFTAYSGDVIVSARDSNDDEVGNIIYMGELASGGNYKYFNKAYFTTNSIQTLNISSGDGSEKKYVRTYFDVATGQQVTDHLTYTNYLTIWWYPGSNWSYFFY